jgi:hypothetical protein
MRESSSAQQRHSGDFPTPSQFHSRRVREGAQEPLRADGPRQGATTGQLGVCVSARAAAVDDAPLRGTP